MALLLVVVALVAVVAAVVWLRARGPRTFDDLATPLSQAVADHPGEITSRYADLDGVSIDPAKIPENLRHLVDLARVWAIGDDVERQRFIESVPFEQKKAFVDAVDPLQDELAAWSQQHRDDAPVPDEVVLFDMMAEAAAEAVVDVYPRGR